MKKRVSRKQQLDRMALRAAFAPRGKRAKRLHELYVQVHNDLRAEAERRRMVQSELFDTSP